MIDILIQNLRVGVSLVYDLPAPLQKTKLNSTSWMEIYNDYQTIKATIFPFKLMYHPKRIENMAGEMA